MKFSDPIALSKHLADLHNTNAVAEHRRKAAPQQVRDEEGNWPTTECVDCSDPIEEHRLEDGRIRCYSCQSAKEKKDATFTRR